MLVASIPLESKLGSSKSSGLLKRVFSSLTQKLQRVGLKVDIGGVAAAQKKLDEQEAYIVRTTEAVMNLALQRLKDATPVETGATRDAWVLTIHDTHTGKEFVISNSLNHNVDRLNFGTRPHVILPRKGKALRFMVGGQEVFATRVNHPGTAGLGFVDKIRNDTELQLRAIKVGA